MHGDVLQDFIITTEIVLIQLDNSHSIYSMKKIISLFLVLSLCLSIFPPDIFALSTGITNPESYPGKWI